MKDQRSYLDYLAELFPTIEKASTEIINLQAIINLPKGTEHFMSDIHGEYEAFSHVLKNGSGAVRKKIDDVFGHTLDAAAKRELATMIYYPEEKLDEIKKQGLDTEDWYRVTLYRLIEVCKTVSSKYTRSKVRKALPKDYAYVIEELITEKSEVLDKGAYYEAIIQTIIEIGRAENFIITMAKLIQRLAVDHLHIVGDIFDRGPAPDKIMDCLIDYHSVDIQWGNHDILWMGAAAGNPACVATVIRICLRYRNMDILEDVYGINMLPLASFAMEIYEDKDISVGFKPKIGGDDMGQEAMMEMKMQKAIMMMQLKLEGQIIKANPEYKMDNRLLLDKIDYDNKQVEVDGVVYDMRDVSFPTVNKENPYELTDREQEIMDKLVFAFKNSEKLQRQIRFLLKQGSLYKVYNGNLLYHGCVPFNEDGSFMKVKFGGKYYYGKALNDILEVYVRRAFFSLDKAERKKGQDVLWFLWCSPGSPLFGKDKMATFESYFIEDKAAKKETKNAYYELMDREDIVDAVLQQYGLGGPEAHIVNGHVPVHQKEGESPMKCNGKVLNIDGGFSKAYQKVTGIAGYTLTYNSYGLALTYHEPFNSIDSAIRDEEDVFSRRTVVQQNHRRQMVGDTDNGKKMKERISELKELIEAYRTGEIKEQVRI